MISPFLSKLLTARQASFTEEGIEIFDLGYSMQPVESLAELQKSLKDPAKMRAFGLSVSNSITGHFRKKFSIEDKNIASIWTNIFNNSGFGKLEVVSMDEKGGKFEIKNGVFATTYKSKFGSQKEPVCYVICGMLEGIFETVYGKKKLCTETSCAVSGKGSCIFEIR